MGKKRFNLKSFSLFFKAIANTKHEMWVSLQVLLAITVVLAVVLWAVEYSVQPDVYSNPLQTFIWASMQYIGDPGHFAEVTPVTFVGRIIAVLIGIIGIAIFAVPAGLIGSGFMDAIAEGFPEFLDSKALADPMKAEYFLPSVVTEKIEDGSAEVKVLRSADKWYGVTYKEDKETVVNALQSMKDNGLYPEKLWN